jgi:hypothetical protein
MGVALSTMLTYSICSGLVVLGEPGCCRPDFDPVNKGFGLVERGQNDVSGTLGIGTPGRRRARRI